MEERKIEKKQTCRQTNKDKENLGQWQWKKEGKETEKRRKVMYEKKREIEGMNKQVKW